jgi:hypothetical protein
MRNIPYYMTTPDGKPPVYDLFASPITSPCESHWRLSRTVRQLHSVIWVRLVLPTLPGILRKILTNLPGYGIIPPVYPVNREI